MAETVGAVGAAAGIPASLQSCIDLVRKAITWREQLSEARRDYEDLCHDLPGLLFELEHLSHTCGFSVYSRTSYERISRQVSRMVEDLKMIETKLLKKRHKVFPSVTNNKITKMQTRVKELLEALRSLREDAENERSRARSEGHDYFLVGRNNARRDGPDIVLNFESREENGQRRTFEGQLLDALLASNSSKTVTACARGYGGVGKTCALRGVAHHPEVQKRFWGGVLYGTLGQDARKGQLREVIAKMVKSSGGTMTSAEISAEKDFEDFVICAGQWFEPYPCLFLIDDVWLSDRVEVKEFELVRNLARHPLSRVAFTTRDSNLRADNKILFEHRERGGEDSRGILLKTAGFEAEPKQPNAAEAFEELLRIGNGLPLKLSLIGGGVRQVAELYSMSNRENAWVMYCERGGHELENEKDIVLKSLSFLDKDSPDGVHHRHFMSLSVLRYAQSVNTGVLSRIWGLSEAESRVEAELLGRYHIVRLVGDITVSLHDEMLKVARVEAERDGDLSRCARRVIFSYLSDARGETTTAVSISGSLEHAPSETRLGLDAGGMVCAVWALPEIGNLDVGNRESERELESYAERCSTVEDDGYFYENLCWLLLKGRLYDILKWLISEPQWLIGQLSARGSGQAQGDLDVVADSLAGDVDTPVVEEMKRNINLLKSTVISSKVDLMVSKWNGMPWFQLYGRLSHFVEKSEWVRKYVGKIERLAPRPWYKPSVGCLLPPSMYLEETVSVERVPICVALFENIVSCCYQERNGDIVLRKYDLSATVECDPVVLYKNADFIWEAVMSEDGRTVVLCLLSGDILLSHLDMEAQSLAVSTGPAENVSRKSLTHGVNSILKRGDNILRKWKRRDQKDGEQNCHQIVGNHEGVNCVARSGNGEIIVSGSWDGSVRVWKMRDREWGSNSLEGHTDTVTCVSASADGSLVVSGSVDYTVRVWKMREGEWEGITLRGHEWNVECVSVSADGTKILSGSFDKTLRVWEKRNAEWESTVLGSHTAWVNRLSVSVDWTQIVVVLEDCSVHVWKKGDGEWNRTVLSGHKLGVGCIAMSGDGLQVISGSNDCTLRLWTIRDGEWESAPMEGHTDYVHCASVRADGKQIVSGSDDGTLRLWKVQDREWENIVLEGHTRSVYCVSTNVDGMIIVSASGDKTLRVWQMRDGEWKSTVLEGHTGYVRCVSMSADGKEVVSGSHDGTVRVWQMGDGQWESTVLEGHTDCVNSISVSGDRSLIVSGSRDSTVRIWTKRDGQWESTSVLEGHTTPIESVSVSANGMQIVSFSYVEGMIWQRNNGEWDSIVLDEISGIVESVTMSEDGTKIIVKTSNERVQWNILNGEWVKMIRATTSGRSGLLGAENIEFGFASPSELNFPLDEVSSAIGAVLAYCAHNSYFFKLYHRPYFVHIEEIV